MSVTIAVNGLTICHKGSGGTHMNSAPDVCKTPDKAIPIPYSIVAVNGDLVKGTTKVLADGGQMIANKPSEFSKCTGDAPGSMNGVASGTILKQSNWITYSPNVYAEGQNICRLTDKLFMNNRNTISGNGGQIEAGLGTGDAVLDALCEIFCEAREEWQRCRGQPGCTRPSTRARNKANEALARSNSPLRRALGNRIGAAERSFFALADNALDAGRKFYTESGIRDALRRQVRRAITDAGVDRLKKMGRRFWLRAVPGLGQVLTGLDVAMTAVDIYNIVDTAAEALADSVRIQPDFTSVNPDGSVDNVYDFKFDAPGYQDEMSPDQRRLYESITDKNVIEVDNATCGCDRRPSGPSAAIG